MVHSRQQWGNSDCAEGISSDLLTTNNTRQTKRWQLFWPIFLGCRVNATESQTASHLDIARGPEKSIGLPFPKFL